MVDSFNMASLGDQGAIFASASLDDGNDEEAGQQSPEPSVIFFRPLTNYSSKNQWLYTLPRGESALSLAIGDGWVAVATNRQLVRVFSLRWDLGGDEHVALSSFVHVFVFL